VSIVLKNTACLITGADTGVGRGLALGFLTRGARVGTGLLDAKKSASRIRGAVALQMDVTRAEQITAAVEAFVRKTGRIDVLINNAGIYPRKAAEKMTFADWQRIMEINLTGVWRCCEAVIPQMKKQRSGVIINVGSIAQHAGLPDLAHYHASKAGVIGLTRGLARDLDASGFV
jgi:NAD(P)-dependent dehydrogenase (short-subunit alcohol dehydrogenase family)